MGEYAVFDYCAHSSKNLCDDCMKAGCCGHAPAISGSEYKAETTINWILKKIGPHPINGNLAPLYLTKKDGWQPGRDNAHYFDNKQQIEAFQKINGGEVVAVEVEISS